MNPLPNVTGVPFFNYTPFLPCNIPPITYPAVSDFSGENSFQSVRDKRIVVKPDRSPHAFPFPDITLTLGLLAHELSQNLSCPGYEPHVYVIRGAAEQAVGGPTCKDWHLMVDGPPQRYTKKYHRNLILDATRKFITARLYEVMPEQYPPLPIAPVTLKNAYQLNVHQTTDGWVYRLGQVSIHFMHTYSYGLEGCQVSVKTGYVRCVVNQSAIFSGEELDAYLLSIRRRHFKPPSGSLLWIPLLEAMSQGALIRPREWEKAKSQIAAMPLTTLCKSWVEFQRRLAFDEQAKLIDLLNLLSLVQNEDEDSQRKVLKMWISTQQSLTVGFKLVECLIEHPLLIPNVLSFIRGTFLYSWTRPNKKKNYQAWALHFIDSAHQPRSYAAIPLGSETRHLALAPADQSGTPLDIAIRFFSALQDLPQQLKDRGLGIGLLKPVLDALDFYPLADSESINTVKVMQDLVTAWRHPPLRSIIQFNYPHTLAEPRLLIHSIRERIKNSPGIALESVHYHLEREFVLRQKINQRQVAANLQKLISCFALASDDNPEACLSKFEDALKNILSTANGRESINAISQPIQKSVENLVNLAIHRASLLQAVTRLVILLQEQGVIPANQYAGLLNANLLTSNSTHSPPEVPFQAQPLQKTLDENKKQPPKLDEAAAGKPPTSFALTPCEQEWLLPLMSSPELTAHIEAAGHSGTCLPNENLSLAQIKLRAAGSWLNRQNPTPGPIVSAMAAVFKKGLQQPELQLMAWKELLRLQKRCSTWLEMLWDPTTELVNQVALTLEQHFSIALQGTPQARHRWISLHQCMQPYDNTLAPTLKQQLSFQANGLAIENWRMLNIGSKLAELATRLSAKEVATSPLIKLFIEHLLNDTDKHFKFLNDNEKAMCNRSMIEIIKVLPEWPQLPVKANWYFFEVGSKYNLFEPEQIDTLLWRFADPSHQTLEDSTSALDRAIKNRLSLFHTLFKPNVILLEAALLNLANRQEGPVYFLVVQTVAQLWSDPLRDIAENRNFIKQLSEQLVLAWTKSRQKKQEDTLFIALEVIQLWLGHLEFKPQECGTLIKMLLKVIPHLPTSWTSLNGEPAILTAIRNQLCEPVLSMLGDKKRRALITAWPLLVERAPEVPTEPEPPPVRAPKAALTWMELVHSDHPDCLHRALTMTLSRAEPMNPDTEIEILQAMIRLAAAEWSEEMLQSSEAFLKSFCQDARSVDAPIAQNLLLLLKSLPEKTCHGLAPILFDSSGIVFASIPADTRALKILSMTISAIQSGWWTAAMQYVKWAKKQLGDEARIAYLKQIKPPLQEVSRIKQVVTGKVSVDLLRVVLESTPTLLPLFREIDPNYTPKIARTLYEQAFASEGEVTKELHILHETSEKMQLFPEAIFRWKHYHGLVLDACANSLPIDSMQIRGWLDEMRSLTDFNVAEQLISLCQVNFHFLSVLIKQAFVTPNEKGKHAVSTFNKHIEEHWLPLLEKYALHDRAFMIAIDTNMVCLIGLYQPLCCKELNQAFNLEHVFGRNRSNYEDHLPSLIEKHKLLNCPSFHKLVEKQQEDLLKGSLCILEQSNPDECRQLCSEQGATAVVPGICRLIMIGVEFLQEEVKAFNMTPQESHFRHLEKSIYLTCRVIHSAVDCWQLSTKIDFTTSQILKNAWGTIEKLINQINKTIRLNKLGLPSLKIPSVDEKRG